MIINDAHNDNLNCDTYIFIVPCSRTSTKIDLKEFLIDLKEFLILNKSWEVIKNVASCHYI